MDPAVDIDVRENGWESKAENILSKQKRARATQKPFDKIWMRKASKQKREILIESDRFHAWNNTPKANICWLYTLMMKL